jgi:hypothetical protein
MLMIVSESGSIEGHAEDDLGGDFVIKARPIGTGTDARRVFEHYGSLRRAPKDSLSAATVTETGGALSLWRAQPGRLGGEAKN